MEASGQCTPGPHDMRRGILPLPPLPQYEVHWLMPRSDRKSGRHRRTYAFIPTGSVARQEQPQQSYLALVGRRLASHAKHACRISRDVLL